MTNVDCNDEQAVETWKEKNNTRDTKENKILKFALLQRMKGLGEALKRIKSWVVIIQSAAEDAAYLKTLLEAVYDKKMMSKGNFVLQGKVKIAGEEAYKQALKAHNEYITSITAIAIEGLHKDALWSTVEINSKTMLLEHYLNNVNPRIESLHETKLTETTGRWLVVCKKKSSIMVKFLNYTLPLLFKKIVDADKIEGYEHPLRTAASGNKTVGSYVATLKQKYTHNHICKM
eukprot:12149247-Ditylum_brightwellii.AAC.1